MMLPSLLVENTQKIEQLWLNVEEADLRKPGRILSDPPFGCTVVGKYVVFLTLAGSPRAFQSASSEMGL
jgi:hypothetical protein